MVCLRREEILFAAFAGWDASGAKAFGFPTFWVNRQNQPAEELGFMADHSGRTLDDLVHYIGRKRYSSSRADDGQPKTNDG